jgi:hypothetical protein
MSLRSGGWEHDVCLRHVEPFANADTAGSIHRRPRRPRLLICRTRPAPFVLSGLKEARPKEARPVSSFHFCLQGRLLWACSFLASRFFRRKNELFRLWHFGLWRSLERDVRRRVRVINALSVE